MRKWNGFVTSLWVAVLLLSSCHSGYSVAQVEGGRITVDSTFDAQPHSGAQQLLMTYKATVDSIMSPVIGECATTLEGKRPESTLSNLLADILRKAAATHLGRVADVGVMNMGGIRNVLSAGEIRFSDVFQVVPFENTLSLVEMNGKNLRELFHQIASNNGEGISGAQLVITPNKELLSATVGGKEIDENQVYLVATIDYIADGNNSMVAFKEAKNRIEPDGETIRKLFLDYVQQMTKEGKKVDAKVEGRIMIKN
ncbi:MAG: 5'-nucleotidase C-terminal domain-containing protein [Phocaeicola sp.]